MCDHVARPPAAFRCYARHGMAEPAYHIHPSCERGPNRVMHFIGGRQCMMPCPRLAIGPIGLSMRPAPISQPAKTLRSIASKIPHPACQVAVSRVPSADLISTSISILVRLTRHASPRVAAVRYPAKPDRPLTTSGSTPARGPPGTASAARSPSPRPLPTRLPTRLPARMLGRVLGWAVEPCKGSGLSRYATEPPSQPPTCVLDLQTSSSETSTILPSGPTCHPPHHPLTDHPLIHRSPTRPSLTRHPLNRLPFTHLSPTHQPFTHHPPTISSSHASGHDRVCH